METKKIMVAPYGTTDFREIGEVETVGKITTSQSGWEMPQPLKDIELKMETSQKSAKELQDLIFKEVEQQMREFWEDVELKARAIMLRNYGAITNDEIKKLHKEKHLSFSFKRNERGFDEFIGIVANNRWLYTPDGKTIGKKGKRFLLEEL